MSTEIAREYRTTPNLYTRSRLGCLPESLISTGVNSPRRSCMSFSSLFSPRARRDGLAIAMRTRPGVTVETVGKTGSSLPDLTTLHNASRDATKPKGKLPWRGTPGTHTSLFHSSLPSLLFRTLWQIPLLGFNLLCFFLGIPTFHDTSITLLLNC